MSMQEILTQELQHHNICMIFRDMRKSGYRWRKFCKSLTNIILDRHPHLKSYDFITVMRYVEPEDIFKAAGVRI